jgi:hypothetical protein
VMSWLQVAGRVLADLVGFALGAMVVPGFVVAGALDFAACAILFVALSAAARPLAPYVACPVFLATLAPALLLVNSGVLWGAVRAGQMLGLGVGFSGVISVLLVAGLIGAVRVTAAVVTRAVGKRYELRSARAEYLRMGHTQVWYREQLSKRRGLEAASE